MALIIDLKPGEKILIGQAVIINDSQRTRLQIAGDAPIMREKDVLQEEDAVTPCKKIYFLIQCMYLARNPQIYYEKYFALIQDIQSAAPSLAINFLKINELILENSYYRALKESRLLIKREQEMIANVIQRSGNSHVG